MNDSQLDNLLNAPLAPVADDGFSARIAARARLERRKKQAPSFAAVFICAVATLLFVPLPQITATVEQFLVRTAVSPAVSLAIAALLLTFMAERALAGR